MWNSFTRLAGLSLLFASLGPSAELRELPEFFRPDPFGGIVACDRERSPWQDAIKLKAARGSYASFHLVAQLERGGDYRLSLDLSLPVDVYREWFHHDQPDNQYYPDALIPVAVPVKGHLPDADNRIPNQTAQAYWVDIWVPPSTAPKTYRGEALLTTGSERKSVPIEITVLPATVPAEDAVTLDNNSYGTFWLDTQYPKAMARQDEVFRLIHAYHRIFYEHRGIFHQLGYGHAGKVSPDFAPELAGTGRGKHVASWDRFDRHYGPLFDGSAFKDTRRGARPIPFVYLPVNPEWPASYLWWGEPGYEAEFVNVLSEMERHFREKNWTSTRFEVFFNHKKRYKGFPSDGDELRFERDNANFIEFHRLVEKAIPLDTPVHFVMRADSSWTMERQFQLLEGVINLWCLGEGMTRWYADAVRKLKQHGDTVWTYGGTPVVEHVSSEITLNPLRSWIEGVDGFVRWLTVSPGPDPWFALQGGGETLVYSGERFGIEEPLASIRLKLQRNCLQDLALLEAEAKHGSRRQIQAEAVRRFNGSKLEDWRNTTHPELLSKPPLDWNNTDIDEALQPFEGRFRQLKPSAWLGVHDYALEQSGGLP